ncbi:hypothetical protein EON64_11120, partial [archaeon]
MSALQRGSRPNSSSTSDIVKRPQTHKDLFDSLIRDIEAEKTFHEVGQEPHPEHKLSLLGHMQEDIEEAVDRIVAEAQYDHLLGKAQAVATVDEDADLLLTGATLAQLSVELASVVFENSPLPYTDTDMDALSDKLTEALSFLYQQPLSPSNVGLIVQAIELEVHSYLCAHFPHHMDSLMRSGHSEGGDREDDSEGG